MNFSEALALVKTGSKIAREGWNAKDQFVYHVPAAAHEPTTDIAREEFNGEIVPYGAYLAIKTVQGIVVPWLASQTDLLAEDWVVA